MARATVKVMLDTRGIREFLHSPDVENIIRTHAARLQANAERLAQNPESVFSVKVFHGKDRIRAHIATENLAAMVEEAADRILMRAMGGGI